jgi:hypothetical protein
MVTLTTLEVVDGGNDPLPPVELDVAIALDKVAIRVPLVGAGETTADAPEIPLVEVSLETVSPRTFELCEGP